MKIAVVWGSTTGNTEYAAKLLSDALGDRVLLCADVDSVPIEKMKEFDVILIGASTWDIGELQYDWEDRLEEMSAEDWSGATFGFFGCGDAVGYDDTFVDAFGIMWEALEPTGARLVGKWPTESYRFKDSRALCDDRSRFLGLALDEENQSNLTEGRISAWAAQVVEELAALEAAA
ncbi:MAG: flavodoxin [Myxococcota bacterium]